MKAYVVMEIYQQKIISEIYLGWRELIKYSNNFDSPVNVYLYYKEGYAYLYAIKSIDVKVFNLNFITLRHV